jgi:hypothetical protein
MRYLGTGALTMTFGWIAIAVLAGLVWLLPRLPEPIWPVPLVLAAIPLAVYLAEWRLMTRRALLGELTDESSHLRGLLWKGRLLQTGAVLAAVAAVTALYLSASFLHWQHWAVLTACVAVLAIATGPVRAMLGSEVSGAHLGLIVRHGPLLWGGALVLGMAFIGLDLVLDQPDLRGASFAFVLETAYREASEGVRSASLGALLGMTNAARMGLWYWAQIVGPQLDAAAWIFWLVFVVIVGGIASLLNAYVLAVIAFAEWVVRRDPAWRAQPFHVGLSAALVVIAALYAFASYHLSSQSTGAPTLPESRIVGYLDPCNSDRTRHKAEALSEDFAAFAGEESARTSGEIAAAVDGAFATLEPAVDAYLDWYFSLRGEYSRLWYAVAGDAAAFMDGKFEAIVLAEGAFGNSLARELEAIESRSNGRMRAMASVYAENLSRALADNRCLAKAAPAVEQEADGGLRNVTGAAAGSLTGAAAGIMLATRLGPRVAARPGAIGLSRAVARVFGKTTGKRAASAGGAAAAATMICGPSGPGAVLCGAFAGIGTWVAVDVLVLRVEEYMNRDTMRADIMARLDGSRRQLVAALETANAARIESVVDGISASRNGVFSPLREGRGGG